MGRTGWIVVASAALIVVIAGAGGYTAVQYASSYVEARLRAETGYRWTVSGRPGIAVSPDFAILVQNAAARVELDAGAGATFGAETVRVFGSPWDLVRGGRATRVEVEAPVAQIPAEYWRHIDVAEALRGAEGSGPARADAFPERVTVRNGRIAFMDGSDRIKGELDGISFDTSRTGVTREATFGARVRGTDLTGDLSIDDVRPGGMVPIRFGLTAPGLLPGRVSGSLEGSLAGGRIILSRLTGSLGPDRFNGAALIDLTAKPVVRLDLGFQSLTLPGPRQGAAQGWAVRPDDLAILGGFDGRLSVYAGSLRVGSVSLNECTAEAEVHDGTLSVALSRAGLYGGQASAKLSAAAQTGTLLHEFEAEFKDVRIAPLLSDLAGSTLIDGTGSFTVNVQGSGRTSKDLVSGLSGRASLLVREGRLNTIDLPGLAQLAVSQLPTYSSRADAATTAFDDASATFRISGGQAATDDFTLNGPVVVATGAGSIDMVAQTLAFRLEPRLVNLKGAANPLSAIRVPVTIEGTLSAPRVRPDLAAATVAPTTGGDGALPSLGGGMLDKLLDAILPPSTGSNPASPSPAQRGHQPQPR